MCYKHTGQRANVVEWGDCHVNTPGLYSKLISPSKTPCLSSVKTEINLSFLRLHSHEPVTDIQWLIELFVDIAIEKKNSCSEHPGLSFI